MRIDSRHGEALVRPWCLSSSASALGVELTWVLGCRVFRCGVESVPPRFLVLIFIIVVYFVRVHTYKSTSCRIGLFSIQL